MKAHGKHRTHSVEFKQQVSQEYLGGETLHALSKRYDISRNLIRIWVEKYQAAALDEDTATADLLQTYEARVVALERLVGKQALELDLLKGAQRQRRLTGCSASSSNPMKRPQCRFRREAHVREQHRHRNDGKSESTRPRTAD
jgi:transposase